MSETPDLDQRETRASGPGVSLPSAPRPTWRAVGTALAPLLLLGAVLLSGLPLCPWRVMTGIPCPGCGLTRATLHAVTGDFSGALHCHPLVFLVAPLVAWSVLRATLVSAKVIAPERFEVRLPAWLLGTLAFLLFAVWAARLAGFLGGPSDPVDPAHGLVGRALHLVGIF